MILDIVRIIGGGVAAGALAGRLMVENPAHLERLRPDYWRRTAAGMSQRDWARLAGWSACILVLCLVATAGVGALLESLRIEVMRPEEDLLGKIGRRLWWCLLAITIGLPVLEEWVFRGMLIDEMVRMGVSRTEAVVISALAFAVFHIFNPGAEPGIVPLIFPAGVLLGICYLKTGLAGSTLAHVSYNLVMLAA
jgi:membrane protease YdiL (CAAX protease family)